MSYCSLEEAYGTDFCKQVNNNYMLNPTPYTISNMNPNRNTFLPGERYNLDRTKNYQDSKKNAHIQSNQDVQLHRQSFNSIEENKIKKTIMPWGDEINENELINESINELSPRENLKKSLLNDRPINDQILSQGTYEPKGYSNINSYKTLESSQCKDFFFHLDSCKKCQDKMKKRVNRYIKSLQDKPDNLPGTFGMSYDLIDKQLFSDGINYESKPNIKLDTKLNIEHFSNYDNNSKAIILLFFGLFIIYILDTSKKLIKTG
jgi:hypothetical protein